MSWRDPNWKYVSAAETNKPNYLRERFRQIREQMNLNRNPSATRSMNHLQDAPSGSAEAVPAQHEK
jgi:hypothetical protein